MCVLIQDVKELVKQYQSLTPLALAEVNDLFKTRLGEVVRLVLHSDYYLVILSGKTNGIYTFVDANKSGKATEDKKKRTVYLHPKKENSVPYLTLRESEYLETWYITKV
jgi:hypothetical protein